MYDTLQTSSSRPSGKVRVRKVLAFLALAFGISWAGAIVFAVVGVDLGSLSGTILVVVVYMWAPAIRRDTDSAVGRRVDPGRDVDSAGDDSSGSDWPG